MKTMTDNEIIKALDEIAHNENLKQYSGIPDVAAFALDLIERLQDENKRLKKYYFTHDYHECHNEAIKEFAERLKKSAFECDVTFGYGREHFTEVVAVVEIDNLAEEMTEGKS